MPQRTSRATDNGAYLVHDVHDGGNRQGLPNQRVQRSRDASHKIDQGLTTLAHSSEHSDGCSSRPSKLTEAGVRISR